MLGETTVTYKTGVTRPGGGLFAARTWTPHFTAQPLRSPLELREMSERTAVLMVRNSKSFEVGKIRHYADRPYSRIYKAMKGKVPSLPALREWTDIPIGPREANDQQQSAGPPAASTTAPERDGGQLQQGADPARSSGPKMEKADGLPPAVQGTSSAEPSAPARPPVRNSRAKPPLKLGAAPKAGTENCDVRALVQSTEEANDDDFNAMKLVLEELPRDPDNARSVRADLSVLNSLHAAFGETTPT